jgi:nickel transport protein
MLRKYLGLPIIGLFLLGLSLSLFFLAPEKAIAHGVIIQYESTSAIKIHAAYDAGDAIANAQVNIFAPNDAASPWLTGTTDQNGNFVFVPDPKLAGNWEVQVRQAGHGGVVNIAIASTLSNPEQVSNESENSKDINNATDQNTEELADQNNSNSAIAVDSVNPSDTEEKGAIVTSNINTTSGGTATYSPMQKTVMIASVLWGCVGTALFFWRRK